MEPIQSLQESQSHSHSFILFSFFSVEQKAVLSGEEQERKITTYEEAMNKIKDTTGVSDIKEVVQRFLSQGETQKHLEQLKTNNEKMLVRLKEEKVWEVCYPLCGAKFWVGHLFIIIIVNFLSYWTLHLCSYFRNVLYPMSLSTAFLVFPSILPSWTFFPNLSFRFR